MKYLLIIIEKLSKSNPKFTHETIIKTLFILKSIIIVSCETLYDYIL
jgi:hypothetical protein